MNELIRRGAALKTQIDELTADLADIEAKLQAEGLRLIDDRAVKSVTLKGPDGNSVIVTKATSVELLNHKILATLLGEELFAKHVTAETKTTYKLNNHIKRVLAALSLGEYDRKLSLKDFLTSTWPTADSKHTAMLEKKLKGTYAADRKLLVSVFGEGDYDIELFCISRILNWQFIQAFLPGDDFNGEELSRVTVVDEALKITWVTAD